MSDDFRVKPDKKPRRRLVLQVTLNKQTIETLGRLSESMGMSRSAVIDKAVQDLLSSYLSFGAPK